MIRVVYQDPESQREVTADFEVDHVRVGREGSNELVLPYMEVSRYHAELSLGDRGVLVTDRSTNGTFINGERVFGKQVLQPGDRLGVGNCVLSVFGGAAIQQVAASPQQYAPTAQHGSYDPEVGMGATAMIPAVGGAESPAQPPVPADPQALVPGLSLIHI